MVINKHRKGENKEEGKGGEVPESRGDFRIGRNNNNSFFSEKGSEKHQEMFKSENAKEKAKGPKTQQFNFSSPLRKQKKNRKINKQKKSSKNKMQSTNRNADSHRRFVRSQMANNRGAAVSRVHFVKLFQNRCSNGANINFRTGLQRKGGRGDEREREKSYKKPGGGVFYC